ncbi:uncharacterized protein LOC122639600 [Telopea speciosissima]|uniref:uncharacterized protein LOC122639600 n=1 Tax=Telopea speciosissima TaxID=54955 RepID=UPI001CC5F65B|nr:uncharacterized protein LOC122639600 [Telopea speciosissima]
MDKEAQLEQKKSLIWDCGSSLYDSFELTSIENQLQSAILTSRRTLSMLHLSSHSHYQPLPRARANKRSSSSLSPFKICRSLKKFIRLVFRSKPPSGSLFRVEEDQSGSVSGGLSTIPEVPEMGFDSLPKRAASQRFTPSTRLGVSCA